ncbi:hypothetical protein V1478_009551 [Vespula squamosa]|uniref:Uncharacterized protein n=1 Tax=Vespula squamosa TaxID=30214 RepID=A0ABD2APZ0_VESSQ
MVSNNFETILEINRQIILESIVRAVSSWFPREFVSNVDAATGLENRGKPLRCSRTRIFECIARDARNFPRRGEVRREGQNSATALEKLQEKRELRALARLNFGVVVDILVHILLRQSDLTSVKRCNAEQNLSENPGSVGVNLFKGGALCNISLFQTFY